MHLAQSKKQGKMKAIDTLYNGNFFRSRMEARWAVFFDAAGIKYDYEPEGFILDNGHKYLPDFYLPQFGCYAEVKPLFREVYDDTDISYEKVTQQLDFDKWFSFSRKKELLLLFGNPHPNTTILLQPGGSCYQHVGFFKEDGKWRFWSSNGSEQFEYLMDYIDAATIKRFEHGE